MRNSLVLFGLLFSGIIAADPIHDAAKGGNVKAVEQQLRHGTNVNIQDELGNTALHYAVSDIEASPLFRTPLDLARKTYNEPNAMIQLLEEAGRKPLLPEAQAR